MAIPSVISDGMLRPGELRIEKPVCLRSDNENLLRGDVRRLAVRLHADRLRKVERQDRDQATSFREEKLSDW